MHREIEFSRGKFSLNNGKNLARVCITYVPVKSRLKHPSPGHTPGISRAFDVFYCPGGREFDELNLPRGGEFDHYL